MKPTVCRMVHYVSHGTPFNPDGSQAYGKECRAAVVTEVPGAKVGSETVGLAVLNPTGMFFNRVVDHDEDGGAGTWHWPSPACEGSE